MQRAVDAQVTARAGVTVAQAGVLAIVKQAGQISQREVAGQLGLNESAVTAMVTRLLSLGLVARGHDPTDARAWVLTLTEQGLGQLSKVQPIIRQVNARIEAVLSADDIALMADALERLTQAFGDDATTD